MKKPTKSEQVRKDMQLLFEEDFDKKTFCATCGLLQVLAYDGRCKRCLVFI